MRWEPGTEILWCYRSEAIPVRVIQDDDTGLAVWLAPGTIVLRPVNDDGKGVRDRPIEERMTAPKTLRLVPWTGDGLVRIVAPGAAHSLWLFRRPDGSGEYWGWYGNLERPHVRSPRGTHSRDHTLDVWLDEHGDVHWKDEDELAVFTSMGRFTAEEASEIRAEGERVRAAMLRKDPPFDGSWLDWRPDPAWRVPTLPDDVAAMDGKPSQPLFPDLVP